MRVSNFTARRSADTAVGDDDRGFGLVVSVALDGFHGIEDVASLDDLAEDDVGTVQVGSLGEAKEELGAVGAWAGVSHGENTSAGVLVDEVLVFEVGSVDGLATGAVANSEVTTLGHEASDDSVEGAALEVEGLVVAADLARLTSAELLEVLGSPGSVGSELHDNSTGGLATNGDVEEDLSVNHRAFSCSFKFNNSRPSTP